MKNQSPEVQKKINEVLIDYIEALEKRCWSTSGIREKINSITSNLMTPNKQLIFETRKEAMLYWLFYVQFNFADRYDKWLSEENVIINNEK
jgi:hypothetical protein